MLSLISIIRGVSTERLAISGRKNADNALENIIADRLKSSCNHLTGRQFETLFGAAARSMFLSNTTGMIDNPEIIKAVQDHCKKDIADFMISQPFGTQNPPDFIVFRLMSGRLYFLCIECKSSKSWKSMWNCSSPKPYKFWIYIHCRHGAGCVAVQGSQLITETEYKGLQEICNNPEIRRIVAEFNKTSPRWTFYSRNMITQHEEYQLSKADLYTELIENYILEITDGIKHTLGQYFTPKPTIEYMFKVITDKKLISAKCSVLEPSCGDGAFCSHARGLGIKTDCLDIDPETKCRNKKIGNFLTTEFQKYDMIIGNPPYVELSDYKKDIFESKLQTGRYNTWALFVEKSIELLNDLGILAFVLPTSIISAPSYQKLRNWMAIQGRIVDIRNLGRFSEQVLQPVLTLVFQKTRNINKDFIIPDPIRFSFDRTQKDDVCRVKIKDVASVQTGSVVWSASELSPERKTGYSTLVYCSDLSGLPGSLDSAPKPAAKKSKSEKYRYVKTNHEPVHLPVLLVSRTAHPECAILEKFEGAVVIENHINIVRADIKTLIKIRAALNDPETVLRIQAASGTKNFSKTQLELLEI